MELLLVKITVSALTVLVLALIAEHVEPRLAGVFSAFPLGAAIVLYFLGLENGPVFVAEAALYATAGLGAALVLVFAYHHAIRLFSRYQRWFAPLAGVAGFLVAAAVLKPISFNLAGAVAVPVVTASIFATRLRHIDDAASLDVA